MSIQKDSICCKSVDKTDEFLSHILEEHANFHCLICEAIFPKYEKLKEHMNEQHELSYDCPIHRLFYASEAELKRHKKLDKSHNLIPKYEKKEVQCTICQTKYTCYEG